jgi:hypothetical protein
MQKKKARSVYGPSESVLEVVAVLRRHVPDDTYRFPPATDFTGRNAYRSSLLRLESVERIHADALRSGYMSPVIQFAKARSLERLRAYDLAAESYEEAAEADSTLRKEALHSAYVCEQIADAVAIGIDLPDPLAQPDEEADQATRHKSANEVVDELEERSALLSLLLDEVAGTHYAYIAREEIERTDEVRSAYFRRQRGNLPGGTMRAISETQRVVARHGPSKNRLRHILSLATLYDELAHEYVDAMNPESLDFDPAHFQALIDPASELYEAVAGTDGAPEKLEAARRLEAMLAFTLVVDSDRFTY